MNSGAAYTLLAAMLTMRPWDDVVGEDVKRWKWSDVLGTARPNIESWSVLAFKDSEATSAHNSYDFGVENALLTSYSEKRVHNTDQPVDRSGME